MVELEKLYLEKIKDKKFVDQFKKYVSSNNEMITYSEVKGWIGYKDKRSVTDALRNPKFGFVEDVEFKIVKEKKKDIFKPINEIYMTIEVIKSLCLMAPTELSQQFRKYYIEMEKIFREYIKNKIQTPLSCLEKYTFDINQWKKKKIVYLIYIKDNLYKYGITADPENRFAAHRASLNYNYIMKCWDCFNLANAKKVEDELKKYLKCNKLNTTYEKQTEIFIANTRDELNIVISKIDEFYKKHYMIVNNKENDEINKKLEKEDYEINFSNRELVLVDKYKKKYNFNLNKELLEELKKDIQFLNEANQNKESVEKIAKPIKPETKEEIKELNNTDLVKCTKCTKCSKKQKQEDFGIKDDGTFYKRCDSCREKEKKVEAKRVKKPLTEDQKKIKYSKRKEKRIKDKLENPPETKPKQTKEEKLENKKVYYLEHKEEIREKYADRMNNEEAKQKERERKKAYYWNNHETLIERNRKYYKDNAEKICEKKKEDRKNN